jgi:multidrug resistance efflux pump
MLSMADSSSKNPIRRLSLALVLLAALLFLWSVWSDRVAPWTDEARVQAWVIPIAPRVSGRVAKISVKPDQRVKAGELLAVIDPVPYEIAVNRAEASLEIAGQGIGADLAAVNAAQAELVESRVRLSAEETRFARMEAVAAKGAVSQNQLDQTRADRDQARSDVASAEAELERARQLLGPEGHDNPRLRDAFEALRQARIDLAETRITAPSDGGITNLQIDQGYIVKAGEPMMTFVSFDDVWIQANFRENSIFNIQPGDRVELVLETAPGRIFSGTVFSSGFAVQQPSSADVGEAAIIRSYRGWLREAQRFPVIIHFDDHSFPSGYRRVGGQTDVQIYTQESNWLLNGLGWIWIRLMSLLSYVY